MSLFAYEAIDAKGRRRNGEIDADSERDARKQLKNRQLVLRNIQAVESARSSGVARGGRHLSAEETMTFLQQLAALFGAGVPLAEALGSIAEGMGSARARRTLMAIRQHLLEGGSLAEALRRHGFDEIVCNMVAAGEETGQLEAVATRLSELLEHRLRLQQELMSAILYPVIIMGFGLLVMMFLLAYVVPQVVSVFERAGSELPQVTRLVIAVSSLFRDYGLQFMVSIPVAILVYRWGMRQQRFRKRRDVLLLQLPGLGSLLAKIETSRFAHTLGMLLAGGVPILPAVKIAQESMHLIPVREGVAQAREALREGGSMAKSLQATGHVPHLALQMIQVGEQSGQLDSMLLRVAENYEQETARHLKRAVTVLEPLLVLAMALVVGSIAMAILLPIVQMNGLIR